MRRVYNCWSSFKFED